MHPIEQLRFVARAGGADARTLVIEAAYALSAFRGDHRALVMASGNLVDRQPSVAPLWWLCSRLVTATDFDRELMATVEEVELDETPGSLAISLGELLEKRTGHGASGTLDNGSGRPDSASVAVALAGRPDTVLRGLVQAVEAAPSGAFSAVVVDVDGQGPGAARRLERGGLAAEDVDATRLAGVVEACDVVVVEAAATNGLEVAFDPGSVPLVATAATLGRPVWCLVPVGRSLPDVFWNRVVAAGRTASVPWMAELEVVSLDLVESLFHGGSSLFRMQPLGKLQDREQWLDSACRFLAPSWSVARELLRDR